MFLEFKANNVAKGDGMLGLLIPNVRLEDLDDEELGPPSKQHAPSDYSRSSTQGKASQAIR
jgi:hypothetical protein